jgi:hypothetical protein
MNSSISFTSCRARRRRSTQAQPTTCGGGFGKEKRTDSFTARYNITRLVYFESFRYVQNAIEREKKIKDWTRATRVALIESINPHWNDLSREWDQPQTFRFAPQLVRSKIT